MSADVLVVVDRQAMDRWLGGPEVLDILRHESIMPVRRARAGAPHLTGAGGASIHAEPVLDGPEWTMHISWDRIHFYMRFHEEGDRYMPARPFLVPAVR